MDEQEKRKMIETAAGIAVDKLMWMCYVALGIGLVIGFFSGYHLR